MRIGFVANQTAVLSDGTPTLKALVDAPGVTVAALFAPEHGAFGTFDADVPDQVEPLTGLPIRSLYGQERKPPAGDLAALDALVFEMQDIGARFYTYASTLGLCLEACAEAGIAFIVFDRPNPITGLHCEGPCADADRLSFTAYHTIPVRHGLTLGELARLYAAEKGFSDLVRVAPCIGWRRALWFDETGVPWINPSPAMRNLRAATLYPGLCLLEQTNISLGRGTDLPFERIGAPYIDAARLAEALGECETPGVAYEFDVFTPTLREFAGEECRGLRFTLTDRDVFNSVDLGINLIHSLLKSHDDFAPARVINLLANRAGCDRLLAGDPPKQVSDGWSAELDRWRDRIGPHLLYL